MKFSLALLMLLFTAAAAISSPQAKVVVKGGWGKAPGQFGLHDVKDELLSGPGGFTVDRKGSVYVIDTENRRLQLFDSSGKFVKAWPYPYGYSIRDIAVRTDGAAFLLEDSHKVGVLKPGAEEIAWLPKGDLQSTEAFRIRATDNGRIYIEEQGGEDAHRLARKYDEDLRYLSTLLMTDLSVAPYQDTAFGITADTGDTKNRMITVTGFNMPEMSGESHSIQVSGNPQVNLATHRVRLVGIDGQLRIYLFLAGDQKNNISPRVLQYSRETVGKLQKTIVLPMSPTGGVILGDAAQLPVIDAGGNIYFAAADKAKGFTITKITPPGK